MELARSSVGSNVSGGGVDVIEVSGPVATYSTGKQFFIV